MQPGVARRSVTITVNGLDDTVRLAKLADDAKFESVWTWDTPWIDCYVRLTAMALATKNVFLAPGVAQAFARSPLMHTTASYEIHRLSGGRFMMGFGADTPRMNLNRLGVKTEHMGTMMREQLEITKLLVDAAYGAKSVKYDGKYFSINVDRYRIGDVPERRMPVYNACVNSYMTVMSAETCDGIAGHPCWYVDYIKGPVYDDIARGLAKSGRDRKDVDLASWLITSISSDRKLARREAAHTIGNYLATRSYAPLLDYGGWQAQKAAIYHAFFELRDMEKVADAVTDDMIDAMALAGTPDDVRKQAKRYEGVIDLPVFYTAGGAVRDEQRTVENITSIIEVFGQ